MSTVAVDFPDKSGIAGYGKVSASAEIVPIRKDDPEMMMRSMMVPTFNGRAFVIRSTKGSTFEYGMMGFGMPTPSSVADIKADDPSILEQVAADMPWHKTSLLTAAKRFARCGECRTDETDPINYRHVGYAVAQTSDRGGLMVYDFYSLNKTQAEFLTRASTLNYKVVSFGFKQIIALYKADINARLRHEPVRLRADLLNFGRILSILASAGTTVDKSTSAHLQFTSVMNTVRYVHVGVAAMRMMFNLPPLIPMETACPASEATAVAASA